MASAFSPSTSTRPCSPTGRMYTSPPLAFMRLSQAMDCSSSAGLQSRRTTWSLPASRISTSNRAAPMTDKRKPKIAIDSTSASVVTGALRQNVAKVVVTNAAVLDQSRVFSEALTQTQSLATPNTPHASRTARTIHMGTAHPRGIRPETAKRYATSHRILDTLVNGANPSGKAAEVVAAADYRALHAGHETGMVNAPKHVATNFIDIKVATDPASRKDLLFAFETKNGEIKDLARLVSNSELRRPWPHNVTSLPICGAVPGINSAATGPSRRGPRCCSARRPPVLACPGGTPADNRRHNRRLATTPMRWAVLAVWWLP